MYVRWTIIASGLNWVILLILKFKTIFKEKELNHLSKLNGYTSKDHSRLHHPKQVLYSAWLRISKSNSYRVKIIKAPCTNSLSPKSVKQQHKSSTGNSMQYVNVKPYQSHCIHQFFFYRVGDDQTKAEP